MDVSPTNIQQQWQIWKQVLVLKIQTSINSYYIGSRKFLIEYIALRNYNQKFLIISKFSAILIMKVKKSLLRKKYF